MKSNYPAGAADDPRAPYNKPLPTKTRVEVGVELGTIVDIEGEPLEDLVKEKIIEKFNVDNRDVILNDITIYNWF